MAKQRQPQPRRLELVETRGSATRQNILDTLAFARDDHDHPRDRLTIDELFERVSPGLWGYAPIAEAQRAGHTSKNTDELIELGKRPYFERCLNSLLADNQVIEEPAGVFRLPESSEPGDYVPGTDKRSFRRMNLSEQAAQLLRPDGSGLLDLFPKMGVRQFDELVLSMKVEGFDAARPVVRDKQTGLIIDGKERVRAAQLAGVEVVYHDVEFADDVERIRCAIRGNVMRRNTEDREALERKLRERHLSTREIAKMLGKMVAGEGRGTSILSNSHKGRGKQRFTIFDNDNGPGRRSGPKSQVRRGAARWGSNENLEAAREAAYAIVKDGGSVKDVQRILTEQYQLDPPLVNSSAWTLGREYAQQSGLPWPPVRDPSTVEK